ncbi:AP2-like ethylene-responsive transcription factor BBM [Vitis vinifera]|uniref:AP2-like ethylene-responsive transcription factor BBM n=1 Tax=Vitis vinifera TaxID=29760 RepID=A0A438CVE8_VITVI|nr:AP2-like ethylene-responsive transcription factor BBM [Vitis vinifera]
MASMNNWLGFSLSPRELPPQPENHSQNSVSRLGFNSDEISGTDVSDWNMKGLGMNSDTNYKTTTSELSMLMGSSCSSHHNLENQEPKLENFLGCRSFADHEQKLQGCNSIAAAAYDSSADYMFPNCSLQLPSEPVDTPTPRGGGGGSTTVNNSSIGLSMIKTWLRNQPAPTHQDNNKSTDTGPVGGAAAGNLPNAQTLSLSMSTGSQSSSPLPLLTASAGGGGGSGGESSSSDNKKATPLDSQTGAIETVPRKSIDTFGQRTSIYRGHRWTGRYEAHLWDNSCRREGQTRKGRQGGYDKEEKAARAYDLAALKYWGTTTTTNFPISNYEKEIEEMKHMTRQEYVASLRRKSSGFSRGASIYRGVTRHHQHGRWQARIGRVAGNKDLYLGTFSTQEEAAEAYDIAAIKFRGLNARLKDAEQAEMTIDGQRTDDEMSSQLTDGINNYGAHHHGWPTVAFQQAQPFSMHYPYGHQQRAVWCKQEQDPDATHKFQDLHQLQLGNTHNFFQPNVLHNLMSMDSSSMDHSSGSNSVIYSGGGAADGSAATGGSGSGSFQGVGYGNNIGFVMPISTVIAHEGGHGQGNGGFGDSEVKAIGYDNMFGSTDPYHARSLYYLSQQSSAGMVKGSSAYDQGSGCNNWVPTAVPTLAPRTNSLAVCHGTPTFTVWNDT